MNFVKEQLKIAQKTNGTNIIVKNFFTEHIKIASNFNREQ